MPRCRLSFHKFSTWISHHPALYHNYYSGFHAEVWEESHKANHPRYLITPCDKTDIVRTTLPPHKHYTLCQIFLLHSIIVICPERKLLKPAAVVCLEGLTVS